jgi:sec-independent protein translocase protein TatA
MRIFKSEVKELQADNKAESTVTPQQPPTAAAPAQPTRVTSERVEAPAPDPTDVRPA